MGDFQLYKANINYHIKNTSVTNKKHIITLPPDTSYQQLIINSLTPTPDRVFLDTDNNYLAEYSVKPLSVLDINLNSDIKIFIKPRPELNIASQQILTKQKKYLLSPKKYWQLNNTVSSDLASFKPTQIKEIFNLVTAKLSYSTKKLVSNRRLGASTAYINPDISVCTEYTDLFVGLSRYFGYYTREIQGFAYTIDKTIRPVIAGIDVLHTWPEYYDASLQLWRPVDPTWADTANIDYFSSFDANHIALAIHGKDSTKPLPAGFFKVKPTKDINISIAKKMPKLLNRLDLSDNIPKSLAIGKKLQSKITIRNSGNYFQYNIKVKLESDAIKFDQSEYIIPVLAPYQDNQLNINYQLTNKSVKSTLIRFIINNQLQETKQLTVSSFLPTTFITLISLTFIVIIVVALLIKK